MTPRVAAAGVLLGVLYTLSPLSVAVGLLLAPVFLWAHRRPDPVERRWLLLILAAAVATRVLAVAGLFLWTDHEVLPFGSLFGDEEYFIRRSLWLRNVALGLPVSAADYIYAFDEYSRTSYLWLLALLHVLFGPAPYGVHLVSVGLYLVGSILLYVTVRPRFGVPASLVGLSLLLFWPSLFAWSVSALKEPLFFALMAGAVYAAVAAARSRSVLRWALAAGLVAAIGYAAQSVREGGLAMAAGGTAIGVAAGAILMRPRLATALVVVSLVAAPIALTRGRVQDAIVAGVQQAAQVHWGHVNTKGYVYTFLDGHFYEHRSALRDMSLAQGARFVAGGLISYVTVPTPAQIRSTAAALFLPEQMLWWVLIALVPAGLLAGYRRDPFLTGMLAAHLLVAVLLVALTSGNVGTLVRHRGLAMPSLVWFSGLGVIALLARAARGRHAAAPASSALPPEA